MPDNAAYLLFGLIVVIGLLGLYVLLLFQRLRAVRQERRQIDALAADFADNESQPTHDYRENVNQ